MGMLYEYEAKELFRKHGIPTPANKLYENKESIDEFVKEINQKTFMAKGQALSGGRGKAGLIKKVSAEEAEDYIKSIIGKDHKGKPIQQVMLEEPMTIAKEYYLAIMINNATGNYHVLSSSMGGVDIESVAKEHPEAIFRQDLPIDFEPLPYQFVDLGKKLGFQGRVLNQFTSIMVKMFSMAISKDLTLVEINPLILTEDNKLIAADAKVVVDKNAYYRNKDLAQLKSQIDQYTELELEATEAGISYVELDGEIGIIACGAGLSMATCDLLEYYGSSPANFLDVGGGADREKVHKALDILSREKIKGIFINVFGGITRCDEVAHGIISAKEELNIDVPIVIRLIGTNDKEGIKILEENGFHAFGEMKPAAKKIVELVKGGN
ncbi:MAG: ADP-forming succinate--CoA ligase subunit beta [Candidatus Heimdallarchaeaceae archaeon]